MESPKQQRPRLPPLFAYAKGYKNGKTKHIGVTIAAAVEGGMGGATGIPMAIGLKLLHEGKIKQQGVFAPEQAIDPDDFFDELAPLCTMPTAKKNTKELLLISSSS